MTISKGFDYLSRHFHSLNRKIWKFDLKKLLKKLGFILKKCQKLGFLPQIAIDEFVFLKSNIKSEKSFLNQTM